MSARLKDTFPNDFGVVFLDEALVAFQLDPFPPLLVKVGDVANVADGLPTTAFPLPPPRVDCAEEL